MPNDNCRILTARFTLKWEARFKDGHLEVYDLPTEDGGGTFEVAGINERYHPEMAWKLRKLIEQEEYDYAEQLAVEYIADYQDHVRGWSSVPAVEMFLRDSCFNRGPTGAAKILQIAIGADVDGAVGNETRTKLAAAENDPLNLLESLRNAREQYERSVVGRDEHSRFWQGLQNRWADLLRNCNDYHKSITHSS